MRKEHIKIIASIIKKAGKKDAWEFSNSVLYNLCKKYPENSKEEIVIAKALIIGRVYSAALERGKKKKKETGTYFYQKEVFPSVKSFFRNQSTSEKIKKLNLDKNLQPIVELHGGFVASLKELRNSRKISFASKYLHFHYPKSFYIYDSRARYSLSLIKKYLISQGGEKIKPEEVKLSKGSKSIKEYLNFVKNAAAIKKILNEKLTVREFDNILIQIADAIPKQSTRKNKT